MQCANCKMDLNEDKNIKGFYTQQNPHFGRAYRQSGYVCGNCGYHNTLFHIPIRIPFIRTMAEYEKLDLLVKEFSEKAIEFLKSHQKNKNQQELFDEPAQN